MRFIAGDLRRQLDAEGFAKVEFHEELDILNVARALGIPIPSRVGGPLVDTLKVLNSESANGNSMSSRFGPNAFPLHTDGAYLRVAPRYILLHHHKPITKAGTLTYDTRELTSSPKARDLLLRGVWRLENGCNSFLTTVGTKGAYGHVHVRYDPCVMRPVCPLAIRAAEMLHEDLQAAVTAEWRYEPDCCLVLDNRRFLHGRPSCNELTGIRELSRVFILGE